MTEKFVTREGTKRFARKFAEVAPGHFRYAQHLVVSSIGIGTYLGNWDAQTDANYAEAIEQFVESGGNVIDTAANYRFQRSERNIGEALKKLQEKGCERDGLLICTKAGFLAFDGEPGNAQSYFEENFVKKGIATFEDLVGGSHCMTPAYLENQIEQSLRNMQVEAIDVFYIHNPESQLSAVDKYTFEARLAKAFEKLEESRKNNKIQFYGVATWNGFRVAPDETGYHSLERMVNIARQIGGESHGFRFIQLPYNLAMPEAFLFKNQAAGGRVFSTIEAANELGVSVMCSASILQGKLAQNLPEHLNETLGNLKTDAQTSIQFVRSTPNVTTALVGMSKTAHVAENLELSKIEPVSEETFGKMFS
jgi:aryl-alcohol dehydrogenase-like predicted oxidoreductase